MSEPEQDDYLWYSGRRWPLRVQRLVTVPKVRFDDRWPNPCDPKDVAYHGTATVLEDEKGNLPTESDLLGRADLLLLLRELPLQGECATGEWQVPIVATDIQPSQDGKSLTFDFMQSGGLGRPLG